MKELSEHETRYINKEKEYFRILSKLHDVTQQLRNFSSGKESSHPHGKSHRLKNHHKRQEEEEGRNEQRLLKQKGEKGEEETEGIEEEEEEIEIENGIVIKRLNKKSSQSRTSLSESQRSRSKRKRKENNGVEEEEANEEGEENDDDDDEKEKENNEDNKTVAQNQSRSLRTKNSYQHLMHVRHKLKKEFLKHFNDNQKQLDHIYLIKELKIPTTLYKLIQESSKMWKSFLNTYRKLEESIEKMKSSEPLEEMNFNKRTLKKLNLKLDNRDEGIY